MDETNYNAVYESQILELAGKVTKLQKEVTDLQAKNNSTLIDLKTIRLKYASSVALNGQLIRKLESVTGKTRDIREYLEELKIKLTTKQNVQKQPAGPTNNEVARNTVNRQPKGNGGALKTGSRVSRTKKKN